MECGFHLGVLRERPDVNVVLHFQSPYATAVACMQETPKDFNVTAEVPCHVGSEIPVIPYFRPGSKELAEAVIAGMKEQFSLAEKTWSGGVRKRFRSGFRKSNVFRNGLPYHCTFKW
mgnify:CR=1 FL=1